MCGLTNSHWERGGVQFGAGNGTGSGVTVHLRNNLVRNVSWHFINGNTNWTVRDNLFDHATNVNDHSSPVANSYNGYDTSTNRLSNSGGGDVTITNFDYQVGPFGNYYYPTNGGHLSRLLDVGSQNATNAGITGAPTLSTTATATSLVGSYPITVGIGTLSAANRPDRTAAL